MSSGYPDAKRLRLLMSSERVLRQELLARGKLNKDVENRVIKEIMEGGLSEAVDLFRHGGFASADEF